MTVLNTSPGRMTAAQQRQLAQLEQQFGASNPGTSFMEFARSQNPALADALTSSNPIMSSGSPLGGGSNTVMPTSTDAEFLARMLGIPPEQAAQRLGISDQFARDQQQQTRNNFLKEISLLVGSGNRVPFEEFQSHPAFEFFSQRASEAGFDPAELVQARNQNIGDFQNPGFASRVGDFFDRTGLGDAITFGTIATAGLGGLGGFGVGPFSGGGAAGGGAAGGLSPVTTSASSIPMTAGQQSALAGLGFSPMPASAGAASFPALPSGLAGGAAGGGALSPITTSAEMLPMPNGSEGFFSGLGSSGIGSLVGGAAGLLDSFMQPDSQTVTQQTQLPPEVQEALSFLLDESMGLADAGSIVPGLSDITMGGIEQLSGPLSGPGFNALSSLAGGQMNPFVGRGNDLSGVRDSIINSAQRAVGDRFSQAGRSGSPAEAMTLGRTVARELAPFEFGARESQLGREFSAGEGMLDRRLSAGLPLMQAKRQRGLDTLLAGGLLDDQARREAMEPFTRLDMMTGPLVSAISGAPRSTSTTQPIHTNPLSAGLGGALLGSRIGGLFG